MPTLLGARQTRLMQRLGSSRAYSSSANAPAPLALIPAGSFKSGKDVSLRELVKDNNSLHDSIFHLASPGPISHKYHYLHCQRRDPVRGPRYLRVEFLPRRRTRSIDWKTALSST